VKLTLIARKRDFFLSAFVNVELLANNVNSFDGYLMIMDKPIKGISGC
jgi:hypothetical protein